MGGELDWSFGCGGWGGVDFGEGRGGEGVMGMGEEGVIKMGCFRFVNSFLVVWHFFMVCYVVLWMGWDGIGWMDIG